jgi:hypothetical protein
MKRLTLRIAFKGSGILASIISGEGLLAWLNRL